MARLNVYVPDDLATASREAGLNVSALTQEAIRVALAAEATNGWLARMPKGSSSRVTHAMVLDVLDEVKAESDA